MLESTLLGLGIGMLRGGRAKALLYIRFCHAWLLLLAFLIERLLSSYGDWISRQWPYALSVAVIAQYSILMIFIVLNARYRSMWLIGAGGLLNAAVMLANGGRMPVNEALVRIAPQSITTLDLMAGEAGNYVLADAATRLRFLGDMIPIWNFTRSFASIGDLFIALGMFLFVYGAVYGGRPAYLPDSNGRILYIKGQWPANGGSGRTEGLDRPDRSASCTMI
ncbi:MAG TPA: hypothetical protein DD727_07855 [Clostridiales bacterium]|nr:hypothetical protein [Clostridiales bacterium]